MKKEIIINAKTVEEAVAAGAESLGVEKESVSYEVITAPKHGFLGIGATDASVKVTYIYTPLEAARQFAETLIKDLELNAAVTIYNDGNGEALLTISGEDSSALIGHHGDTLDAFQYLINLAANKKENDERKYTRITVDIENYREKREQTLRQLARRMAAKVKKYGKNLSLEPMSSYERRIIHSEIQLIDGVSTNSVGTESNRRVVIFLDGAEKPTEESEKLRMKQQSANGKRKDGKRSSRKGRKPRQDERAGAEKQEKASRSESAPRTKTEVVRREPRKIEKAKDLDSYFEKLKEFSSTFDH